MTNTTEAAIARVRSVLDVGAIKPKLEADLRAILAHLDAQAAEIERLTAALKKANDQAEHFEREWYLRGDEIERLRVDAERYAYAKTLEGQALVIDVFQQDGADALDSEIDKERGK